jgi:hypothetical protein
MGKSKDLASTNVVVNDSHEYMSHKCTANNDVCRICRQFDESRGGQRFSMLHEYLSHKCTVNNDVCRICDESRDMKRTDRGNKREYLKLQINLMDEIRQLKALIKERDEQLAAAQQRNHEEIKQIIIGGTAGNRGTGKVAYI